MTQIAIKMLGELVAVTKNRIAEPLSLTSEDICVKCLSLKEDNRWHAIVRTNSEKYSEILSWHLPEAACQINLMDISGVVVALLDWIEITDFYRPPTKLREGNTFTDVCHSAGVGVGNIKCIMG